MSFFQTNFYPLTLSNIDSSSTSIVPQEIISKWSHDIMNGGEACNAYYHARSKNETYTHHNAIYKDYAYTLQDIFDKVSQCNASTQLILIQDLQHTLSKQGDDHFGETFMRNYDSFIQDILTRLLETTKAPLTESRQMKEIAFKLLTEVLSYCRPFESLSWATERLYDLDWTEHHDEGTRIKLGASFVITIESYGQSVLETLDPLLASEYVSSLLTPCTQALSYVDNILRHSSPQNQQSEEEVWHLETLAITNTILDLVSFCYDRYAKLKLQETDSLLHIANYLLVLVFDKFVLNIDLDLSNTYYERFHTRYTVKGPNSRTAISAKASSNKMVDCVSQCLELATRNGVTFDKLLSLRQHYDDPMTTVEESRNIQSAYPFSCDGIVSFLALSVFNRYLSENSTGSYVFPILIEPMWIGRQCLGMLMNLIKNPQDTRRIDKSLLILLYLADNMDNEKITITLDDLDKEFTAAQDADQKLSLVKSFQILTSMTSMTDDSKLRFLGHQLIARFIQFGRDDTRLFILTELLENCPYPTMRTAAIGLLKNQVDQAFGLISLQQETPPPVSSGSPFCTKLLLDKFFPMIYENQVVLNKGDHLKKSDQDIFWEKYSYHMQALNFYYYLVMRDKKNNMTCVWDRPSKKWMKSHYLGPLEQQCTLISQTYQQRQSSNATVDNTVGDNGVDTNGEVMQLTLMIDMINQITNLTKD